MSSVSNGEFNSKRTRLESLLVTAGELEHLLCCQYLFAAFSLRSDVTMDADVQPQEMEKIRLWKGGLFKIARQEMVHLAYVGNLLTAIGESAVFWRPDFPAIDIHYPTADPLELCPFGAEFLDAAMALEAPATKGSPFEIGDLYETIEAILDGLSPAEETKLFHGPMSAQIDNASFIPSYPDVERGRRPRWDMEVRKICDRRSAKQAIRQIRQEGEGGGASGGHFQDLMRIKNEYDECRKKRKEFRAARAVVKNPCIQDSFRHDRSVDGCTVLTNSDAINMAKLFDHAYEIMLRMLSMFFGQNALTRGGTAALRQVAFLPFMSLVLRPLGEMLTVLPAHPTGDATAGAPFHCPRSIGRIVNPPAVWDQLTSQLQALYEEAELLNDSLDYRFDGRIKFMTENIWRIAANFGELLERT